MACAGSQEKIRNVLATAGLAVFLMNSFSTCLALAPVAIYLLFLGFFHCSRRAWVVSAVRDAAGLAFAVSGLVLVGPLALFTPLEAHVQFGPYVWPLLTALYVACVVLALLTIRPKLIVYNMSVEQLRPLLADVVERLDPSARWAGDCVAIPDLDVQFHIDNFSATRTVSLISVGGRQNRLGWQHLETALRSALSREEIVRNPRGLLLIFAGLLCLAAIALIIALDPEAVWNPLASLGQALLRRVGL